MIQNYPEWDGFAANPQYNLTRPRSDQEYELLKQAWLKQTGSAQVNGIVLHNASLFFASYEPALAVELLKRAIGLDPHELVYVERLGMLYSTYLMPGLLMSGVTEAATFKAIAQEAENELAQSDDWVFLGGALTALHAGGGEPVEPDLYERLKRVRPDESVWSVVDQLPSKSAPWIRSTCAAVLVR